MYCKYCGQLIDDDSLFCAFCGKKLKSIIEPNIRPEDKVAMNAVFSDIEYGSEDTGGLIEIYPLTCNFKLVPSGYVEDGICHIYISELTREGSGLDVKYDCDSKGCTFVEAHLSNGSGMFHALLDKEGKTFRLSQIYYTRPIEDVHYNRISCYRGIYKRKQKFIGITVAKEYDLYWGSGEHFLTDAYYNLIKADCINEHIPIEEWMNKYGSYFWDDIKKYYNDLEDLLGFSPYYYFEFDKYNPSKA